ncbi:hypothetical protein OA57_08815 [Chelonobacter oris]|uniref:Uncharacterized protein n=1 Tax=Chelonobacter oris TaxID=505317 RepID=A0A0A3AK36_9PAST|nr:CsiV family protein [Chelonobacter oris]KGQ69738.1 hypothetical protein OA57_08815 [Chelonobacter oris]
MTLPKSFLAVIAKSLALLSIGGQLYAAEQQTTSNGNTVTANEPTIESAPTATAQDSEYASQANVEIILFQRLFENDGLNQKFPELTSTIPVANAVVPAENQIYAHILSANEMQLNDIYTKFQQHDAYIPFYHQAWVQPLTSQPLAVPVRIQSDASSIPTIDGRLLIWQDNNIELNFNLAFSYHSVQKSSDFPDNLNQDIATVPDIDATDAADPALTDNNAIAMTTHTIQYQSQSSYVDNQMMYFDHPLFGILVLINSADGKPLKGVSNSNNMLQ